MEYQSTEIEQEGDMKGHYKNGSPWRRGDYMAVSTWLTGVAILLFTAPAWSIDDHRFFADTRTSFILKVADNPKNEGILGTQYNPMVSYPGDFEADQIYRKNLSTGAWKSRSRPAHLKDVSCFEAKSQLSERGLWKGNLNQDGSCGGSAEASDWAVGNFLNFQFQGSMNTDTTDTEGETE
jgi:hypothetical protein